MTGMSGVGKSTALAELATLGFQVVETDDAPWSEWSEAEGGYVWREDLISELLSRDDGSALYVSGTVSNQGRFYSQFDAVVLLSVPVEVLLRRTRPERATSTARRLRNARSFSARLPRLNRCSAPSARMNSMRRSRSTASSRSSRKSGAVRSCSPGRSERLALDQDHQCLGQAPSNAIASAAPSVSIAAISASMSATSIRTPTRVGFSGSTRVRMFVTPSGPKTPPASVTRANGLGPDVVVAEHRRHGGSSQSWVDPARTQTHRSGVSDPVVWVTAARWDGWGERARSDGRCEQAREFCKMGSGEHGRSEQSAGIWRADVAALLP